jgi:hypothetical protein
VCPEARIGRLHIVHQGDGHTIETKVENVMADDTTQNSALVGADIDTGLDSIDVGLDLLGLHLADVSLGLGIVGDVVDLVGSTLDDALGTGLGLLDTGLGVVDSLTDDVL